VYDFDEYTSIQNNEVMLVEYVEPAFAKYIRSSYLSKFASNRIDCYLIQFVA